MLSGLLVIALLVRPTNQPQQLRQSDLIGD
jgi:hypothetical protein